MTIATIIDIYDRIPDELKTIFLIALIFAIYKNIIKIPWLNIKKKDHLTCSLYDDHMIIVADAVNEAREDVKSIYDLSMAELKEEHMKDRAEDKKRSINDAKITRIKKIEILDEQMSKVSIKQSRIMMLMNSAYFEINKNKPECESYENLLLKEKSVIKTMIRQWLRLNGYSEMNGDVWHDYKHEHISLIIDSVTEFLDKEYDDSFYSVTRGLVKENNFANNVKEIETIYNEMFDDCRSIAIKFYKRIEELENEKIHPTPISNCNN